MIQIPIELNGYSGIIEVNYVANPSPQISGFNLLKGLPFPAKCCIGYPMMHAKLNSFEGSGYAGHCAWIQIVNDRFYKEINFETEEYQFTEVDVQTKFKEIGFPFFAFGYPAEIFDAPCDNLRHYKALDWVAETFLTSFPNRINDECVEFIAGFRWGYKEYNENGERKIIIHTMETLNRGEWNRHLPLLRSEFGNWKYI